MATWQDIITAAQTLLQRWKRDVDFTSQIVNGPATGVGSTVDTDGGTIPTFAKTLGDFSAFSSSSDAGSLNGAEIVPVSRGAGVLKTTLTAIAQWVLKLGVAKSVRYYGAVLDGTTNCASAILAAIDDGVTPLIDGPCYIEPANATDAATLLNSFPNWQVWGNTVLQLPRSTNIPQTTTRTVASTSPARLTIKGVYTNSGAPSAVNAITGSARNYSVSVTIPNLGGAVVGDYIMLEPNQVGSSNMGEFIAGCWRITGIAGNVVTFLCGNSDVAPANDGPGVMASYIVHTVVRFARDSAGLRLNSGVVGGITNVILAGAFDFTTEAPFDGAGDGLQVGGAPDTYMTGLNASEQLMGGSIWLQRVGIVEFQGNGVQVLGGRLVGSLLYTCGNSWRGQQAAGTGYIQAKGSISAANGASAYETEEGGSMNCHDSWAIGNMEQGVFAIGNSQVSALDIRCRYNLTAQLDARNGGVILGDTSVINGTTAIFCNGGRIVVGSGASVTGAVSVDEIGVVDAKGATTFPATATVEAGSVLQKPDGTLYNAAPNINQLLYNDDWKYRVSMSSIGTVTHSTAPYASSTYVDHINIGADGSMWPPVSGRSFGRTANPWFNIVTSRVLFSDGTIHISGTGSPEGSISAAVGSWYYRSDGAGGTYAYRKNTGTGNTGWVAIY